MFLVGTTFAAATSVDGRVTLRGIPAAEYTVRVLRVDLGEEDGVWLYELRLIDDENSVIKVGYRADNLEMVWLKGHHLERLFEPRPPPEEE